MPDTRENKIRDVLTRATGTGWEAAYRADAGWLLDRVEALEAVVRRFVDGYGGGYHHDRHTGRLHITDHACRECVTESHACDDGVCDGFRCAYHTAAAMVASVTP